MSCIRPTFRAVVGSLRVMSAIMPTVPPIQSNRPPAMAISCHVDPNLQTPQTTPPSISPSSHLRLVTWNPTLTARPFPFLSVGSGEVDLGRPIQMGSRVRLTGVVDAICACLRLASLDVEPDGGEILPCQQRYLVVYHLPMECHAVRH